MKKLTEQDFIDAADMIGCDVAAVKAVAEVESGIYGAFIGNEPVILFERHWFHRLTGGKWSNKYPDISNPKWGGYGKVSQQHKRLQKAVRLNKRAALKSASWGLFQILGVNYKIAGHPTLQSFINAMYKEGERGHLMAFVNFVINKGLDDELRDLDWAGFAYGYNGSQYRRNKYHIKMANAYERFKKQ